jgi:hypothetical protein
MVSGRIRARAIAMTPNSVSAPSPKFQRVRWIESIEVVRRLIERESLMSPARAIKCFTIPADVRRTTKTCAETATRLGPYWTPEQAFAVFELIDELRDTIWRCYALQIQEEYRDQRRHDDADYDPIDANDPPF